MNAATIRQTLEEIAVEELTGFLPLRQKFDIGANDDRALAKGLNVMWGPSDFNSRGDQVVGVSQNFTLDVTVNAYDRDADVKIITAVDDVYVGLARVINRCVVNCMELSPGVISVSLGGITAPRPIGDSSRGIVSITLSLTIDYIL